MEIFLTFLIITYRRPEKVVRLLQSFLDDRWQQLEYLKLEIVIADDHGEDNTGVLIQPVIEELREKGWTVRYVYRENNLRGDRNLYYGYTRDSLGKFVWFLCDDDIIHVPEAINYIKTVEQTKPLLAICGFEQGDKNQYGNKFEGSTRLISDLTESIDYLIKFPKTTAYLMRRCPEVNLDILFEKLDRTLYSWIGLSIYLICIKSDAKLLLYPQIVATSDEGYSLLPYSYRIFGTMYFVVKQSTEFAKLPFENIKYSLLNLKKEDELTLNINGLSAHYSWRTPIKYTPKVYQEEINFLKDNWLYIFRSFSRIISLMKLIIYRISYFFLNI